MTLKSEQHIKAKNTTDKVNDSLNKRYVFLDGLRGLTLLSMILYHMVWDLVYLFGLDWKWYRSGAAYLWQQSICWVFIFLSGFCWSLGKRKWKRGVTVFIGGLLITAVTLFVMPEDRVIFGVLTCIGSCTLLMIPFEKLFKKCNPYAGIAGSMALFVLVRNVNIGYLGFEAWKPVKLPDSLYRNWFTAYWGFPDAAFYSTDYFSVFPWIFLYIAGYFLYRILDGSRVFSWMEKRRLAPVEWLGRHSLEIYMVHQPVLYLVLNIWFLLKEV